MIGDDLKNTNPLLWLLIVIAAGIWAAMKFIPGFRSLGGGTTSYRRRRALAKARRAKRARRLSRNRKPTARRMSPLQRKYFGKRKRSRK